MRASATVVYGASEPSSRRARLTVRGDETPGPNHRFDGAWRHPRRRVPEGLMQEFFRIAPVGRVVGEKLHSFTGTAVRLKIAGNEITRDCSGYCRRCSRLLRLRRHVLRRVSGFTAFDRQDLSVLSEVECPAMRSRGASTRTPSRSLGRVARDAEAASFLSTIGRRVSPTSPRRT